jgi:hypothetical protein
MGSDTHATTLLRRSTMTAPLLDTKIDPKLLLSGLWTTMLFVFAYVDIFGFWRADVIQGALDGEVPGVGFEINQAFLTLTTVYILIPSLMVVASLLLTARAGRIANLAVAALYLASIVVSMIGETWVYFLFGSAVELVLLLGILRVAWTWPPAERA